MPLAEAIDPHSQTGPDMRQLFLVAAVIMVFAPAGAALAQSFDERMATCLGCHGAKGQSGNPEVPSLGGQPENYLLTQIFTFREKLRVSELMNEQAKDLKDDDLRTFSAYLAKLPVPPAATDGTEPERMARAAGLIGQHRCSICHKQDFSGGDQVPRVSAQREDYLLKSMRDYKSGARTGYDPAMIEVMRGVNDEQIIDLAHYLARTR
jgi:cytochrome c553